MNKSSFDLGAIGASDSLYAAFQSFADRGFVLGRISVVHREQYRAYTTQGEIWAEAIGALLYRAEHRSELPAVGDWVAVQPAGAGYGMVHAVMPRRTVFSRRAAGDREEEQIIAANVDLILVVCGLDHDFNPRRIERYVALARESGAEAAIVLNKADVCVAAEERVAEAVGVSGGSPVIAISAQSGMGADRIREMIGHGTTVALSGSSGTGKSTLMNHLLGEDRQRVREVRETDSRGRHTTTHRELVPLPGGGALIDSPGMRELQLWAGMESLESTFDEIVAFSAGCRFRDCTHMVETGCAVRTAVECGELEPGRFESYRKLRAEIAWHERKSDIHVALAVKQRWKAIHKAMRGKNR